MKVVHVESGLGNQMLAYAEYLAIKKMNPKDAVYIETIIYDIPKASKVIAQWNGYELENIFGISAPNIKQLFTNTQWNKIIKKVENSEFWKFDWNYPEPICSALNSELPNHLINECVSLGAGGNTDFFQNIKKSFFESKIGYLVRTRLKQVGEKKYIEKYSHPEKLFFTDGRDMYCGFTLLFQYRNNDIEKIDADIRSSFVFPALNNERDISIDSIIKNTNSIAIHIRKGDRSASTNKYYTGGYFNRATKYIKRNVKNPIFFVFSDPDSCKWARENYDVLGLTCDDTIHFVDWHRGDDSYRDMQLISHCKHAIITVSSFSWWGAYLIENKNKIIISPEIEINTNVHV